MGCCRPGQLPGLFLLTWCGNRRATGWKLRSFTFSISLTTVLLCRCNSPDCWHRHGQQHTHTHTVAVHLIYRVNGSIHRDITQQLQDLLRTTTFERGTLLLRRPVLERRNRACRWALKESRTNWIDSISRRLAKEEIESTWFRYYIQPNRLYRRNTLLESPPTKRQQLQSSSCSIKKRHAKETGNQIK
jgi:hypothetical protein